MSADLTPEALAAALPGRPLRCYSAVVSTGTAARAWAAGGAPDGAVVVAQSQISPRGHAGRPLGDLPADSLGFSVILRPSLAAAREGWLYTVALTAFCDALGEETTVAWPDEVRCDGEVAAAVAIQMRAEGEGIAWAVLDALVPPGGRPRDALLATVLGALDGLLAAPPAEVRRRYEEACETLGLRVGARLRAGTGPRIEGEAIGTLDDGALELRTEAGTTVPVRPQDVRGLEEIAPDA